MAHRGNRALNAIKSLRLRRYGRAKATSEIDIKADVRRPGRPLHFNPRPKSKLWACSHAIVLGGAREDCLKRGHN